MAAPMEVNTAGKDEDVTHPYESDIEDARIWMRKYIKAVRLCEYYKSEYKDCKSLHGKFHNYYTFGEQPDCEHWKKAYDNCQKVKSDDDEDALDYVVEHELVRRDFRLRCARNNDVWEYRNTPPSNWNTVPEGDPEAVVGDPNLYLESDIQENSEGTAEEQKEISRQRELAKIQEDLSTSKTKVNPKYDDTVQRCIIL